MDYDIEDALTVLNNLKNNPYGIKDSSHSIIRSRDRFISLDVVYEKLSQEKPVAIEKDANSSSRFLSLSIQNFVTWQ